MTPVIFFPYVIHNLFAKPFKPKLVYVIFKHSARTSKKIQHFAITKINWLTLFKEIIAVFCEKHMDPINKFRGKNLGLLKVKVCGTYSYQCALERRQKTKWYSVALALKVDYDYVWCSRVETPLRLNEIKRLSSHLATSELIKSNVPPSAEVSS
jgi:hypothetical protein